MTPKKKRSDSIGALAVVAAVLVATAWGGSYFVIKSSFGEADWGKIGDMFGAVNALFSGLGLVGVVVAILLQREDLRSQQEQMLESNRELSEQNKLLAAQVKTMQDSFNLAQQQYREGIRPCFVWLEHGGQGNPDFRQYSFKNVGGRCRIVQVTTSPPIDARIEPEGSSIGPDEIAKVKFTSLVARVDLPSSFDFWFDCLGTGSNTWRMKFRVTKEQWLPKEKGE